MDMNTIFNMEGPIFTIINKIADVVILSVLWVLFSLPIVTIGAATTALYHATHKVIMKSEGYVFGTFFKSFKANLKQSIFLTLLFVLLGIFAFVCYNFSSSLPKGNMIGYLYYGIMILVIFLMLILVTYGFAVLSRFYMKTMDIMKAAIALAVTRIGCTLLLALIFTICGITFYLIPGSVFILPVCCMIAAERLIEPALLKITPTESPEEESSEIPS